jgi:hypothetical protein
MADHDLELDRGGVPPPVLPPPPETDWRWWILGAVVLAMIGGGLARWWTMDRTSVPETPPPAASSAPPPAATTPTPPAVELPPFEQMDPFLRALLGALSARPELARWLATDQLLLQMAAAIDRVARGDTPAPDLKVLAPAEAFTPATRGRVREIGPDSFRRYDCLAETLAGIDPAAAVRAYRTIQPRLDEAYRRLGRAESGVDVAVRQALDVLIATPIPDGPLRIEEGRGATWRFADPALESLPPAQKQLLRMGPQNAARIIDTLRQVRQQLQP